MSRHACHVQNEREQRRAFIGKARMRESDTRRGVVERQSVMETGKQD